MNTEHQFHGRVRARPAREIAEHVNTLMMKNSVPAFARLIRYHFAYLTMLTKCGILPRNTSAILLRALRRLAGKGTAALCLDPARHEELQPALEAWVVDQVGIESGGQLNTGRSRQECQMVAEQLSLRDELLETIDDVLCLAQPNNEVKSTQISHEVGHVLKHVPRLLRCYREVNRSRAGVGSVVPTNFGIDREMLAGLLGFDGCLQNSLYGYSAFDIEVSLLSVLELLAADLSRYTAALCQYGRVSCIVVSHYATVGMHEAQRARFAASNLYLDTTPVIRGAITFSTHDCLRVIEHLRMVLRTVNQVMRDRSRQYGEKRSKSCVNEKRYPSKSCLASYIRRVGREKTRLRQAEAKLRQQVSHVIRSVAQSNVDGLC